MIKARKTPYTEYKQNVPKKLTEWTLKNSEKALNKVLELKALTIPQMITEVQETIRKQFESDLTTPRKVFNKYTPALYKYRKSKFKIIKADYTDNITDVDQRTIELLTNADMIWVLEFANNTLLMEDITLLLTEAQSLGMTMQEAAKYMTDMFSGVNPELFFERYGMTWESRYGQENYWRLVARNNTHRVKAYANINDMEYAGVTQYRWRTRGAAACPICQPMDDTVYEVSDAKLAMERYFNASERGDVEGMKTADPFLTIEDVQEGKIETLSGVLPPLHHNCLCEIVIE
jgi:hypothetical protein